MKNERPECIDVRSGYFNFLYVFPLDVIYFAPPFQISGGALYIATFLRGGQLPHLPPPGSATAFKEYTKIVK